VILVEQFARAVAASPGSDLHLELVGDGPTRPAVQARVAELVLGDRVSMPGWLPREQTLAAYRRADCLVNPSSGEGLPNVVLEAMACGVAIVASRVAGNDTLVRHGENGLLFDWSRPDEMGDGLARLAADPALRRAMGERGREMALSEYSWSSVARKYAELFQGR
jgi:glycosyltransferase involved in cell wall biosynthesis